ncbi:MAG: cyclopropane-fatty-acyl-phospholipid synthase [Planctomycetota bacterium]|jgi:cyclopropane-fatty-acyl-phospholipid synthase
MNTSLKLVEKGLVPKPLLRHGIRKLLGERLVEQQAVFGPNREAALNGWAATMRASEIAPVPEKANEQHYEVPPEFFEICLGPRLKYSSAFYSDPATTLEQAEQEMLRLTTLRADLKDGQDVLELGCGWGSLTLWMAENFPASKITAVSNSGPQRKHILARAKERGLSNLEVLTADMNNFQAEKSFDRVVSVEMFEHMRNWEQLLGRIALWLRPEGRVFLHVFAHKSYAYPFEVKDESDWMSKYFFTGGMMPCPDLVEHLDIPFDVEQQWEVSGTHYARTSEHWLDNLEQNRARVLELFKETYGPKDAVRWYHRWRVFFLSCAELFAYDTGREWFVSHMRLAPSGAVKP